jgi:hypothetical protein
MTSIKIEKIDEARFDQEKRKMELLFRFFMDKNPLSDRDSIFKMVIQAMQPGVTKWKFE